MIAGLNTFSALRMTRIIKKIQDKRDDGNVRYRHLRRLNRVPAVRDEMFARFTGRVLIADMIALDVAAGIYSSGQMDFVSYDAPKIKIGRGLSETQLDQLLQFVASDTRDEAGMMDYIGPTAANALEGVTQRMEALYVGMLRDRLDYDKLGFKASGSLWGMPSDLRLTPSVPYSNTNSTPIDDTLALMRLARIRYGEEFNRIEMSTAMLQAWLATTEFQNKAKVFLPSNITLGTNISLYDTQTQKMLLERTLGGASGGSFSVSIELNDDRYHFEHIDPTSGLKGIGSARYQPINEIYLTNTRNDRNDAYADIAACPVVEAMMAGVAGRVIEGASLGMTPRRGPISYMTVPGDMNPPSVTFWAADVAWPRRHHPAYSAFIDGGKDLTDDIPVSEISF